MEPIPHEDHDVQYVMTNCTAVQNCTINEKGDVVVDGPESVERIDGDTYVYCVTCDKRIHSGEDGLAEDWELA
jgi:RNA polymerase-binding transcription factor DksA